MLKADPQKGSAFFNALKRGETLVGASSVWARHGLKTASFARLHKFAQPHKTERDARAFAVFTGHLAQHSN